ncbi:MAG TPA: N-6 DNA methylase [Kofleriaceae bacterium]|nr:N-6 DNA methylase [Kofleriaceae bacterium]
MVDNRRQIFGQVFTPPALAELTLSVAGVSAGMRVLDPACGDGEFLARANSRGAQAVGFEIDPEIARLARARVPEATVRCADFTARSALPRFDAVVGNPPYVRGHRVSEAMRQNLATTLAKDFPGAPAKVLARVCRGDLAAGFFARALAAVRPGGTVALVVSSALLDADYAAALWTLCARVGRIEAIIDAPRERWFAGAAVNAVVMVARRVTGDDDVAIARLSVPTRRAATVVTGIDTLAQVADIRTAPARFPARWGALVRAPAVWLQLERAAAGALCPLGDIAEVRRGLTTGANDLFYVSQKEAARLAIEAEALVPVLRAPRSGAAAIRVDAGALTDMAIVCPSARARAGAFPRAAAYFAGHAQRAQAPTLRNRDPWWAMTGRPARVFLTKAYAQRFVQRLAESPMVCDQRFYAVWPRANGDSDEAEILAAILNSTFTSLAIESVGRASMGEGALEISVGDAAALPVIDPRRLSRRDRDKILGALRALWQRPIGPLVAEAEKTDRTALDLAVARAHPDLGQLLGEAREALVAHVSARHARATAHRADADKR